jgi:hypothetical protein
MLMCCCNVAVTGQLLNKRRSDRRKPPSGEMLRIRISEIGDLFDQVMGLMDDCPSALRLDFNSAARSVG